MSYEERFAKELEIIKHATFVDYMHSIGKDRLKNDPIARINSKLFIMALNHEFYQGG